MQRRTPKHPAGRSRQAELQQLYAPITELFLRAGFTGSEIRQAVASSIARANRTRRQFTVKRVGDAELYAAIIRRWTVNPAFANAAGRPAVLPISGNESFTSLARECGYRGLVRPLINLMVEHGSLQWTRGGGLELVLTHMKHYRPDVLSYEWNYQFLSDAIAAATRGMGRPGSSKRQLVSFVNVGNNIAGKHVATFLAESRRRNVAFAGELSPWLEHVSRHRKSRSRLRSKTYRLGVGVFPICSSE
jgi:hypothetical protein